MKKKGKLTIICCILAALFMLGGCGDSDSDCSTVHMTSFSLSVYDKYKYIEDESLENEKYFASDNSKTVLLVFDTLAGNADIEANVDFYKMNLAEQYGISENEIKAVESPIVNHKDCWFLTWEYSMDNDNYSAVSSIIYEEGAILFLTETSSEINEAAIKAELLEIAESVKYTDDYQLPSKEEYPFTVENASIRITVKEGYICTNMKGMSDNQQRYITESNLIKIVYAAADDYDRGMISSFRAEHLEKQDGSIKTQAEDTYQHYQDLKGDGEFEEPQIEKVKIGDIWTELEDGNLADRTAYKVSVKTSGEETFAFSIDRFYFEKNDSLFCFSITYPFEDKTAKKDMYQLFYVTEFLSGAEDKTK